MEGIQHMCKSTYSSALKKMDDSAIQGLVRKATRTPATPLKESEASALLWGFVVLFMEAPTCSLKELGIVPLTLFVNECSTQ